MCEKIEILFDIFHENHLTELMEISETYFLPGNHPKIKVIKNAFNAYDTLRRSIEKENADLKQAVREIGDCLYHIRTGNDNHDEFHVQNMTNIAIDRVKRIMEEKPCTKT